MNKHLWTGFFMNLSGVVLGIILTFGGNSLWQKHEEKKKTREVLILVRKELNTNKEWFKHQERVMRTDSHVHKKILEANGNWKSFHADTLMYYYHRMLHFEITELTISAWQVFQNSDIIQGITDKELVIRLADCYFWIKKVEEMIMNNYWDGKSKAAISELDPHKFFDAVMDNRESVYFYNSMSSDQHSLWTLFPTIDAIIDYTIRLLDEHGDYRYDMDDKDEAFESFVNARVDSLLQKNDTIQSAEKIAAQLRQEIVRDLTDNILPFWVNHSPDPSGGFYGTLTFDGKPKENAMKGGILNARLLWTFSAAFRLLNDAQYLTLANRAQRYFLDHFMDTELGGSYYTVAADGKPLDMQKNTYQNAFAVYGLSEHYRATGIKESLDAAVAVYRKLVEHAYDPVNGGFIESFDREWQMIEVKSPKTMNTNLHVLEALTNLYRVWKDPGLKQHLREEIAVMSNKVLNQKTWHEQLYLTMDWVNQQQIDSYGHDIEFSWLLVEAAEALGDEKILKDTKRIAVNLAAVQLEQGVDKHGAMMYEYDKDRDHLNDNLSWWPQNETVVGCLNAWQISGDRKFLDAAVRNWEWIKTYMIDYEYGEWYGNVSPDGTPRKNGVKADQWRCPYHNSRMGFEVMTRIP